MKEKWQAQPLLYPDVDFGFPDNRADPVEIFQFHAAKTYGIARGSLCPDAPDINPRFPAHIQKTFHAIAPDLQFQISPLPLPRLTDHPFFPPLASIFTEMI